MVGGGGCSRKHCVEEQTTSLKLDTQHLLQRRGSKSYKIDFECENQFALCSRNFQNVKLRIDFVQLQSFYHHSNFTWNHILGNSNSPKMFILTCLEVLNFDFSKFEQISSPKFTRIQSSESTKLPKMTFLESLNRPKLFHIKLEWR